MKFLMNENVPLATIRKLKNAQWDLIAVSEVMPSVSDEAVMELAIAENRTIITFDRDYGTLI
jgi:predicted nuclease of predicted toxin-antitoxin system